MMFKLLASLVLFFVLVLGLVWITEITLFSKAYESYQVSTMNNIAKDQMKTYIKSFSDTYNLDIEVIV